MVYRFLICALLLASMAAAQDEPKKQEGPPQGGPQAGMMPKPSPELEKMAKMMAGKWTTTEKHEPSQWAPNGATGKGTATITRGPGGFSLVQHYNSSGSMGKFEGHGVSWWDAKAGGYKGIWCDSMTPECSIEGLTKWEGDTLVGESEQEMGGQKMKMKSVISDITPNSFTMKMDMGMGDQPMKPAMTIQYKRSGGSN